MLYTSLEELDADDCSFAFIHWMLCSRHIHYYLVYIPCLRVLSTFLLFQFPLPNHKSRSPFPPPALVANDDLSCPQHVFDSCQTTPVAAVAEGASLLNMQVPCNSPLLGLYRSGLGKAVALGHIQILLIVCYQY